MTKAGGIQVQAVRYHNDPNELRRCLQNLNRAAEFAGVPVSLRWGDASAEPVYTPKEWETLQQEAAHLVRAEYCFFGENTGYGRGNNRLAEDCKAEYLLIMNPEITLSPRSIAELLAPFSASDTGLTEARQIPVEHPKAYDFKTGETEWSSGACFMIPRALFESLNGFDAETFFMYCEDVDLSWRIRLRGKRLIYRPEAGVFHARRLSDRGRNQASRTEQEYTVLSEALLAYKWSYPRYARERIRKAVERGDPGSMKAQRRFEALEQAGKLPDFLDPEHRIARIQQNPQNGGMLFTTHRFGL